MLVYFPSVYLLVFVSFGFFIMRPATFRERVVVVTGFISVILVVFTVYFWFDSLPQMLTDMVNFRYRVPLTFNILNRWQIIILSWILLLSLLLLVFLPGILFSSVIQTRKYISILLIGGAYSLLALPLAFNFNLSHLIFALAALAFLYTLYFVESKTNLFQEILFLILLLSVFIFQYLPFFVVL